MNSTRLRRPKLICTIDASGFASIMIVLMIAMLFSAAIAVQTHHGVNVDLPRVKHAHSMPEALREGAPMVVIKRDGEIYFNQDLVASEQLASLLRQQLSYQSEKCIYIRTDALTPYHFVKPVLDGFAATGVTKVSFFVEQKRLNLFH